MTLQYEDRIVAYADVIGWKAACEDPERYSDLLEATQAIAQYAHNFSPEVKGRVEKLSGVPMDSIEEHASFEFSFFSDNLAVSVPLRYADRLFKLLSFASHSLLQANFLIRGGVASGKLHHRHNILFGPALIEAVDLERKADYPRLLCSRGLLEFLATTSYKDNVVIRDREQAWIVNVACGGPEALGDLDRVLERGLGTLRLKEAEAASRKRAYLREMLPAMFLAKGVNLERLPKNFREAPHDATI